MRTVREVSELSGVSVRTLHHYDAIGLLKPTAVTEAGYRLYDDAAMAKLQTILLFRELRFPLKEIRDMLADPRFDRRDALRTQVRLLEMERARLQEVIALANGMLTTGGNILNFKPFDKSAQDAYAAEAKARWGRTGAWQESQQKAASQSDGEKQSAQEGLMAIFAAFGAVKHLSPDAPEAVALAEKLQGHITAHYYTCTKEILRSLGQMYTADERFTANIDRMGGEGAAAFAAAAIAAYCK